VSRHSTWMEIAKSSADVRRIVSAGRMAVILGVEIDDIGNFQLGPPVITRIPLGSTPSDMQVRQEIDRLYSEGVRYIFPIHLLDNPFGGTATYIPLFDTSNLREMGSSYQLTCSVEADGIHEVFNPVMPDFWMNAATSIVLGGTYTPQPAPGCAFALNGMPLGHKNALGLRPSGVIAINEMMRLGMLIDIDHMSQASANSALEIAERVPGGYPLMSGHNGLRNPSDPGSNERSLTAWQYSRLGRLHGMAGVGGAGLNSAQWLGLYSNVLNAMGPGAGAGFGTDANGLERLMPTRCSFQYPPAEQTCINNCTCPPPYSDYVGGLKGCQANCGQMCAAKYPPVFTCPGGPQFQYSKSFPASTTGLKTWNYYTDGVAHYGMLADFLADIAMLPGGAAMVQGPQSPLMRGAEYFAQTWAQAEAQSALVAQGVASCMPWPSAYVDVTGDGKADAVVVLPSTVVVRRSDGTKFLPNEDWGGALGAGGNRGTFFADVNGDGKADAIAVNSNGILVRLSTGNAFQAPQVWSSIPYYGLLGTYFADVTGDGKADAIVVNPQGVTVRRSNGTSFLPNETWTAEPYYGSLGTYFADVTGARNAAGYGMAAAIAINPGGVTVRRSDGTKFLPNETWLAGPISGVVYFADVNGDGKADLIAVTTNGVQVYLSDGTKFIPTPAPYDSSCWERLSSTGPYWSCGGESYANVATFFADVNGDGKADYVLVNADTPVVVQPSNGTEFVRGAAWTTEPYWAAQGATCNP
jgi:VCBS repeat protein